MSQGRDQYLITCWDRILQYLVTNHIVEPEIIEGFYRESALHEFNDQKAIITCPNIISIQIISEEIETMQSIFMELFGLDHPIDIEIMRFTDLKNLNRKKIVPPVIKEVPQPTTLDGFESMTIQPDRTFSNFVKGDCNRESQVAALACAHNPGKNYNPLFIYGNSGLGKTHLLMAIGNYVKNKYPNMNVYYIESLKFVEKVVQAIQTNQIDAFKRYMCNQDLLLIDDIQFLAGKEKSHEVFFTIYNELVNNKKQICIASDRQPKEIKGLEARLISRFSSGLSVGIDTPEFETSLAILRMKLKGTGIDESEIDDRGLAYIASNFNSNVRDLEGALNRVMFFAINFADPQDNVDGVITFETVCTALKAQTMASPTVQEGEEVTGDKIIKTVADYYGLTKQQIVGKSRTRNIANARHIAIYLNRKLLDLPYVKIGEKFGGRDHSTVISSCTKVEKLIKQDPAFTRAVSDIEKLLNS